MPRRILGQPTKTLSRTRQSFGVTRLIGDSVARLNLGLGQNHAHPRSGLHLLHIRVGLLCAQTLSRTGQSLGAVRFAA